MFTKSIKDKLEENEISLDQVQFYNSRKIVLHRALPHDEAMVNRGSIRFENGKMLEQIIIKNNTPCVCKSWDDKEMEITFETGQDRQLTFTIDEYDKYFQLLTERNASGHNTVFYDTTIYRVYQGGSRSRLMVKKNEGSILLINQRVARGQTVR